MTRRKQQFCIPSEKSGGFRKTGKPVLIISSIAKAAKLINFIQPMASWPVVEGGLIDSQRG